MFGALLTRGVGLPRLQPLPKRGVASAADGLESDRRLARVRRRAAAAATSSLTTAPFDAGTRLRSALLRSPSGRPHRAHVGLQRTWSAHTFNCEILRDALPRRALPGFSFGTFGGFCPRTLSSGRLPGHAASLGARWVRRAKRPPHLRGAGVERSGAHSTLTHSRPLLSPRRRTHF